MEKKPETSEVMQLLIIFGVCVVGEILHALIPLPISAGVYGMFIMFFLLLSKLIKLSQVEKTGDWLVGKMLIMFIPASVGLIDILPELKAMAIPVVLAITVVTVLVMVITGKTVQAIVSLKTKKESKKERKK